MPLMPHPKQCAPLALALATCLPVHAYELYNQNGSVRSRSHIRSHAQRRELRRIRESRGREF